MHSTHRLSSWDIQRPARQQEPFSSGTESQALVLPGGKDMIPVSQYDNHSRAQWGLDERSVQPSRISKHPSWTPESFQNSPAETKSTG